MAPHSTLRRAIAYHGLLLTAPVVVVAAIVGCARCVWRAVSKCAKQMS